MRAAHTIMTYSTYYMLAYSSVFASGFASIANLFIYFKYADGLLTHII